MMMRFGGWIFRWAVLILLISLATALFRVSFHFISQSSSWRFIVRSPPFWMVLFGWIFRISLTRLRGKDPLEFLDTLEHELSHALVGTLTFAPPISLKATREGGEVELSRSNPIATLAPYFLPLIAFFTSLVILLLKPNLVIYGQIVWGILMGSFIYRMTREFHWGQTDLKVYGRFYSFCLIASLLPLFVGIMLKCGGILPLSLNGEIWTLFLTQLKNTGIWILNTGQRFLSFWSQGV